MFTRVVPWWVCNPLALPPPPPPHPLALLFLQVVWLSGMINPQSFLTAIAQQTAQKNSLELDKLVIQTDVTKRRVEEVDASSRDGAFVSGFFLQGCRWDTSASQLDRSRPREMFWCVRACGVGGGAVGCHVRGVPLPWTVWCVGMCVGMCVSARTRLFA